jgi:hypothetical protein
MNRSQYLDRIIAQLQPAHPRPPKYAPAAASAAPDSQPDNNQSDHWNTSGDWQDGPANSLDIVGSSGMYASFEYSDLYAIGGWIRIDGETGALDAQGASAWGGSGGRRDGLGFGR